MAGGLGDGEFLFGGEEVGDEVVGVGGVGEGGGWELGREEVEEVQETGAGGEGLRGAGEGVDDGELEIERGEVEGVAATPDLEGEDVVEEAALADVANLFLDVGLEPGGAAELPEGVIGGVVTAARGDEIDVEVIEADAQRDVAGLGREVTEEVGEGRMKAEEGAGSVRGEAEEEVHVHIGGKQGGIAKGGAFGVGAGEGDGLEVRAGPAAEEWEKAAAESAGSGVGGIRDAVACNGGEEVEVGVGVVGGQRASLFPGYTGLGRVLNGERGKGLIRERKWERWGSDFYLAGGAFLLLQIG